MSARTREKLPPWSELAERSILAWLFNEPGQVAQVLQRFQARAEVFYSLQHREIWLAMTELDQAREPIDVVTVVARLRKFEGRLERAGGYGFVSGMPDAIKPPWHPEEWQDLVWEKFLARELVKLSRETAYDVWQFDGLDEHLMGLAERRFADWKILTEAGAIQPKTISKPSAFAEKFFDQWFQRKKELAGWELPVKLADLRIRPSEFTLFTADNGAGKSTFLGHLAVILGMQGLKTCVASLEVPCEITLWVMSRQLIGSSAPFLEPTDENVALLDRALAWLEEKVLLYNFLGIGNWHHILDAFRFAQAKCGAQVFILDSALKLGIPDDDYAQQTVCANAFSDFCVQTGAHLLLVVHQNKAEGKDIKKKVRGAGAWTDAAHVVLSISRNESKDEKLHTLAEELRLARLMFERDRDQAALHKAEEDYRQGMAKLRAVHDSTLILKKQRSPAAQWQNASRHIYFHRPSLQFLPEADQRPVCYLDSPPTGLTLPTTEELYGSKQVER